MEFRVSQKPTNGYFEIYSVEENCAAYIQTGIRFPETEVGIAMAHDYVDFLNDKYFDKGINEEWPSINRRDRINYHLKEIEKLVSGGRLYWNEHGNGVEE